MRKKFLVKNLSGILILIFVLAGLAGCSSKSAYEVKQESVMDNKADRVEAQAEEVNGNETIEISLGSNINRKIIKSGELIIETKAFEKSINDIFTKLKSINGFVEKSTIEGAGLYDDYPSRSANITVRIPNTEFDAFLNSASSFGNVRSKAMTGEDVTDSYVDTEARLKSLQVQRERLLALLEQSGSLEDLFSIEKELANVSYEIEKFQGTLNKYDSLIEYSTINIGIQEVKVYQDPAYSLTLYDKIATTFKGSLEVLKKFGEKLLLVVVSLIPFILIIGLPVGAVVLVLIKARHKLKKSKGDKENK